jgi:hypothetical protein
MDQETVRYVTSFAAFMLCLGIPVAMLVCLPDIIATWRGVELKDVPQGGAHGDIANLIDLIVGIAVHPFRLFDAIFNEPTNEVRGWEALLHGSKSRPKSLESSRSGDALQEKQKRIERPDGD